MDEALSSLRLDRRAHQPGGFHEYRPELLIGDLAEGLPGRHADLPQGLRLPHVAYTGNMPLIENGVTDRTALVVASQIRDHRAEVDGLAEDVRAEPVGSSCMELEDRAVPEDSFTLAAAEHEPRTSGAPRTPRDHPPPAGHSQMAPDDVPAFETQKQVLAHRFDAEQPPPVEPPGQSRNARARVWRLDLDFLTDERLQPASCSMETVPFGH
jgi:hypothetical protein